MDNPDLETLAILDTQRHKTQNEDKQLKNTTQFKKYSM
jgi:hypothetical protein